MHYVSRERTRILLYILLGVIVGAIGVFQRGLYTNEQETNPELIANTIHPTATPILIVEKEEIAQNNNAITIKKEVADPDVALSELKLKRSITVFHDEKEPTIIDNAFYDINLSFDEKKEQATINFNINVGGNVGNSFSVFLSKKIITEESSFSSFLKELPFCFYVKSLSKPPIIVFPSYFKHTNWLELEKKSSKVGGFDIDYVDVVDLVKSEADVQANSNSCEIYGRLKMKQENQKILIDSEAEGIIDVSYEKYNLRKNKKQELSIEGMLIRNYSIQVSVENPYLIENLIYETISDTTMSISNTYKYHQIITEKIQKVD